MGFYRNHLRKIQKREYWNMIVIDGIVGVGKSSLKWENILFIE